VREFADDPIQQEYDEGGRANTHNKITTHEKLLFVKQVLSVSVCPKGQSHQRHDGFGERSGCRAFWGSYGHLSTFSLHHSDERGINGGRVQIHVGLREKKRQQHIK
jgi:hypothetical protein